MVAPQACPFIALDEDRDRRVVDPDAHHRCFAESVPRPRSLAHQAAFCLTAGFAGCPIFLDWASRAAAAPLGAEPDTDTHPSAWGMSAAAPASSSPIAVRPAERPWLAPPPWVAQPQTRSTATLAPPATAVATAVATDGHALGAPGADGEVLDGHAPDEAHEAHEAATPVVHFGVEADDEPLPAGRLDGTQPHAIPIVDAGPAGAAHPAALALPPSGAAWQVGPGPDPRPSPGEVVVPAFLQHRVARAGLAASDAEATERAEMEASFARSDLAGSSGGPAVADWTDGGSLSPGWALPDGQVPDDAQGWLDHPTSALPTAADAGGSTAFEPDLAAQDAAAAATPAASRLRRRGRAVRLPIDAGAPDHLEPQARAAVKTTGSGEWSAHAIAPPSRDDAAASRARRSWPLASSCWWRSLPLRSCCPPSSLAARPALGPRPRRPGRARRGPGRRARLARRGPSRATP